MNTVASKVLEPIGRRSKAIHTAHLESANFNMLRTLDFMPKMYMTRAIVEPVKIAWFFHTSPKLSK